MKKITGLVISLLLLLSVLTPAQILAQDPLTESITTEDGDYIVDYPSGWDVFEGGGLIGISNRPDVDIDDMQSGDMAGLIVPPTAIDFLGFEQSDTPQFAATIMENDDSGVTPSSQVLIDLGSKEGFRVDFNDEELDSMVMFFEVDGGLAAIIGNTLPGEMGDYATTLYAIAAHFRTVGSAPPEALPNFDNPMVATTDEIDLESLPSLDQTYTSNNGQLSLRMPSQWSADESTVISILSPNGVTQGEVPSGEVSVYIRIPDVIPYEGAVVVAADTGKGMALQWGLLFRFVYPDLGAINFVGEQFTLDGREMYLLSYQAGFGDIALIGFNLDDGIGVMAYAISAPNEMDEQLPTVLAIAASIALQ